MLIQIKLNESESSWFKHLCDLEDRSCCNMAKRIILKDMPQNYKSNKNNSNDYQQDPYYRELAKMASECDDPSLKGDLYEKMNAIKEDYNK